MPKVAELKSCDGFTLEGPTGCLGWVEETWLDAEGHPGAVAVRTPDGTRALLLAGSVLAVDPDAQEVLVGPDVELHALEPPRIDGTLHASWRATDEHVEPLPAAAHAAPAAAALAAARATTYRPQRAVWQTIAFALCCLAALVAFEIGLAFGVAYLVTGHAY